ncbi:hypothetical protein CU016_1445 [Enterococcus lactis]|nr:hypothetical protein [Enterococcus lactis]MBL5014681.1 hypothetical protein [Enterococcus lactis]
MHFSEISSFTHVRNIYGIFQMSLDQAVVLGLLEKILQKLLEM